jgi:hypothetical protein
MNGGIRTTWKVRAFLFGTICGAAYLHVQTPAAPAARPLLVAGGLTFLAINLIFAVLRIPLGHWRVPGLLGDLELELGLGVGLPAAIAAALGDWSNSEIVLGIVAAALYLLHGDYVELQVRLAESVRASGRLTFGDWVRGRPAPRAPDDASRLIGDVTDLEAEPPGRVWLAAKLTEPSERGLTFMRIALCWLVLTGFWISADALGAELIHHHIAPTTAKEETQASADQTDNRAISDGKDTGGEGQATEGTSAPRDGCLSETPVGAPRWARHDLRALYLGGLEGRRASTAASSTRSGRLRRGKSGASSSTPTASVPRSFSLRPPRGCWR